jgi:hypothetical protein
MLCVEDRLSLTQTTVPLDMNAHLFYSPKNLNTRFVIPPFSKNIKYKDMYDQRL